MALVGNLTPDSLLPNPKRRNLTPDSLLPNPKRQKTEPKIDESSPCPNCVHWFVYKGICIFCNSSVDKTDGQSFAYLDKDRMIMSNEAVTFSKQVISRMTWLEDKKLHLVLDLDHTLLHSVLVSKLSESEKYLLEEAESREDLWRFKIGQPDELLIKLRPFVRKFLEEAREMFTMHVYTKGDYGYAQYVLELIDPKKRYFGDRVITRRESPGFKTLDLVLADERGVVIVDDKRSVWPDHKRNLLQIAKYRYFKRVKNKGLDHKTNLLQIANYRYVIRVKNDGLDHKRNLLQISKYRYIKRVDDDGVESKGFYLCSLDESEENGPLASVLRFLKEVYRGFFSDCSEEKVDSVDVRPLLRDPLRSKRKNISETRKIQ